MNASGMARNWNSQPIGELFENLPHELSREERFEKFVADNPEFVDWFCTRAMHDRLAGMRRGSAKLYFEEYRGIQLKSDEKYRLNNNFTSLMARLAMERYPILGGFFETRELCNPMRKVPKIK